MSSPFRVPVPPFRLDSLPAGSLSEHDGKLADMSNTGTIERGDVERALWDFTQYKADATAVDGLLVIIDAYSACQAEALVSAPQPVRTAYLHSLVNLVSQLLDTGGKMRFVAPKPEQPEPLPEQPATEQENSGPRPGHDFNSDGTITCRVCLTDKQPDEFSRGTVRATGKKSRCKGCDRNNSLKGNR